MQINENKKKIYIRKESNSERICLEHQYGRRFIVLEHQYSRRDVLWKRYIKIKEDCFFFQVLSFEVKSSRHMTHDIV